LQRSFESYEIESLPIIPLLYDTGYLTIKSSSTNNMMQDYILTYPNLEVKNAMLDSLFRVNTEDRTSLGRIDLVLESDLVFIFLSLR
jgi:hypothetical protein